MWTKEQLQKRHDDALDIIKSREGEVTVDPIDVELAYTVKILREILQIKGG